MAQKEQQRERLLSLFQKVCSIPRQTGDEEGISRFLMEFARVRGLAAERESQAPFRATAGPWSWSRGTWIWCMKRRQGAPTGMRTVSALWCGTAI